jgi:hypothetical protein
MEQTFHEFLVVSVEELEFFYATGDYGLERLEATMADLGLTARAAGGLPERPVTFKWLHRMLQDRYYIGCIVYKGEIYDGRHEPIVDPLLFDRVQEVIAFRSKSGQGDRVLQHYLKGILFCDRCERNERTSRLIYTEATNRFGNRYGYFLCRGRQDGVCDLPYLPAAHVEQAIVDHYTTLDLPTNFIDRCANCSTKRSAKNNAAPPNGTQPSAASLGS